MALREGWELSDRTRTLVVLAAAATWLASVNQKNLDVLKEIAVVLGVQPRFLANRKNGAATTTPISREIKITW